jgi:Kyakuja-Dileera-Zisupton transposase
MKYPIAVVNRLLDQYGEDIGLGYDIMCAFIKTLLRSSLGAKTVGLRLQGIVPAFHGHAHNRGCQVHWHPMYMEGVGLEDFEECERTFYKSNELASITRLASPFHRQQQIDEHFFFHDLDKHAASGSFFMVHKNAHCDDIMIRKFHFPELSSGARENQDQQRTTGVTRFQAWYHSQRLRGLFNE